MAGRQAKFWMSFALAQGLYLLMALWSLPKIAALAGGLAPFDMRPLGYDLVAARAFLAALPIDGFRFYLGVQLPLDVAYPAALALMFVLGLRGLYAGPLRRVLLVLALGAAAFDYLENIWISMFLALGPDNLSEGFVAAGSAWTVLKSVCTTSCYIALVAGAGRWALKRRIGARA